MKMTLALMREGDPTEGLARRLQDLDEEIDHLDGLVEEILTATRLDVGTTPLRLEDVDLARAIDDAVRATADVGSPVEVKPSPDVAVQADPRLLDRVLCNLLSNARRYAKTTVEIAVRKRGSRIEITVSDDGPGVEPEQLDHLFEPFYRADRARPHGHHVGMGLAIVHKAVAKHGGQARAGRAELGGLAVTVDFAAADRRPRC